ncbi:Oxysterol-binding protein-related protein 2 [Pteropus alecto]|uniref:Oxysterol-binding protein n=1 Tax=Pteropus alecto TaxID=9402 RepID=L5JYK6_PTEAL|nr:Oxysterol-binding protein-related protein 2 [Pteropus alecto]
MHSGAVPAARGSPGPGRLGLGPAALPPQPPPAGTPCRLSSWRSLAAGWRWAGGRLVLDSCDLGERWATLETARGVLPCGFCVSDRGVGRRRHSQRDSRRQPCLFSAEAGDGGPGGGTRPESLEDLGFRFICEQVSHHPPVSAFHSEGLQQDFLFHGSIYPKLRFWGKSVEAEPRGTITLELLRHSEAYTWTNPTCCVHNVIIGKLWIEQYGTVEILNHRTGDKCVLHFKPCGLFGKELHRVEGHIQDKNRRKLSIIYGKWTEGLWGIDPVAYESFRKQERRGELPRQSQPDSSAERADSDVADAEPEVQETVQVIPGSQLLWRVNARPPNSAQMYNFTSFTVSLNELQTGMEKILAPTDCRLRPDIRGMEDGNMDLASQEKERLEEKQREARRERAREGAEWQTRWFRQGRNPHTGTPDWLYAGGYFERDFSGCPDIY